MQPSSPQCPLQFPFTRLLGQGAQIRLLRLLAAHEKPLSVTQLAQHAGLTPQGTRLALAPLTNDGLVQTLGAGRSRLFMLDVQHPFGKPLRALFHAEQARWDRLLHVLRGLLQKERQVQSAWYRDAPVRAEAGESESLLVTLVVNGATPESVVESLNRQSQDIRETLGIDCRFTAYSLPDLLDLAGDDAWWTGLTDGAVALKGLDPAVLRLRSRPPRQAALFGPGGG